MSFKTPYPDVILNAFKSVQAWKSLSLVLMGMLLFAVFALGWMASHQSVILIPQGLSNAKKPITLSLGEPFSPDYLTSVAKGDLFSLLNWTPDNIDEQYGQFIVRLEPSLVDGQRQSLLNEAKQHREEGLTQSFFITRTFVKGPSVVAHGILVRSAGGREVFRGPAIYQLDYTNSGNGLLLVAGVSQPNANAAPAPASKN
ncbi:ABC transporter ATP-binding protein [Novimethylophilus kurashikiensis]|uniref:ABC transporter ATP-binding protein n=1 Tax=Novimethylophilus kurashikiensis TaxID=1825523 RepID=A0A2R5F9B1_9PROT|nr:TraE/TraK family type IV conjugative transfer system protein [Novimethylophilus kurashikiensis]GBG14409.1 ABC transporter ATP-binding protein [Novimethylophilus kurashikiensis]